jgi:Helicase
MSDIQTLKNDLGVFSHVVKCPLTDWQLHALSLDTRVTTIVAPRQSGKSRSLSVLGLHAAFRRRCHVLIVSAGEDSSRRLLGEIRAIVSASPLLRASAVDEQAQLLTLSNGSQIRSVPASERQVRGWTVDLLLVDEAALVPDDLLLGAAFPTTAARPDAHIVLASSATSASGAFYDACVRGEAGDEYTRTYRWALADATWIAPSVIASARASMSEMRFNAEYMGQFASGADSLFPRHILDAAITGRKLHAFNALEGPARVFGGVDWGATIDRNCLCAIARVPNTSTFTVVTAHRWLQGIELHKVTKEIADSPALFGVLTMETNGLGLPLSQEVVRLMRERHPYAGGGIQRQSVVIDAAAQLYPSNKRSEKYKAPSRRRDPAFVTRKILHYRSAESKAAAYSALRLLIDRGQLTIPRDAEELIRELILLRVNLSPTGGEKIEASSGHDDYPDALTLALAPHKLQSGEWRCAISRLAETRAIRADTPVAGDDLSAYQSCAGGEISARRKEAPS